MRSKASATVALLALAVLTTYAAPQGRNAAPQGENAAPQAGNGAPQAGRGAGQRQAPSTTATPANDPKKVIETMQDNLGMLRGMRREDAVNRIEMWGTTGTKMIDGKAVPLTNWRMSVNYTMNGLRFDYTPQGGKRTIEVVSDKYAWNEDMPGGKATAMPAALQERQVQFVLTPIGMAKAAKAAGDMARVMTTGGVTTLTFPTNGATITATLNKYMQPVKAQARLGATVLDVTYDQYGDWNDDAKADVYLPKHVVETQNGMTVLDLTIKNTNTYNPYVITPVPANVKNAGGAAGARSN
jgi:hypothetical protein